MTTQVKYTDATLTLSGSSETLIGENVSRSYLEVANRLGNDPIYLSVSGGTASLLAGIKIPAGGARIWIGAETPAGAVTVIGTAGNIVNITSGA